jgi:hypothetical protein
MFFWMTTKKRLLGIGLASYTGNYSAVEDSCGKQRFNTPDIFFQSPEQAVIEKDVRPF